MQRARDDKQRAIDEKTAKNRAKRQKQKDKKMAVKARKSGASVDGAVKDNIGITTQGAQAPEAMVEQPDLD